MLEYSMNQDLRAGANVTTINIMAFFITKYYGFGI
jgi:hypothetical protein